MEPTPTNPQPTDPHRQALDELIAIGVDLARHIQAQTTAPYPILHDYAAESFERISRAVRRTILLARRLEDLPATHTPTTPTPKNPAPDHTQDQTQDQTQNPTHPASDPTHPASDPLNQSSDPTPPTNDPESRPDSPDRPESLDRQESQDRDDDDQADDRALAPLTLVQALQTIHRDLGIIADPPAHAQNPENPTPTTYTLARKKPHPDTLPREPDRPPSRLRLSARNYPPINRPRPEKKKRRRTT